jgi:CRP-like cAMP-binding protein
MPVGDRSRSSLANHLLSALPRREHNRLAAALEPVALDIKQVLYEPGEPIEHIYFPERAVIAICSRMKDGRVVEAGMVGNEGAMGIQALFGVAAASHQFDTVIAGNARRIKARVLKAELKRGGMLEDLLLRYTQAHLIQATQIGACNCLHTAIERVCRWLLMVHDRAMSDELSLTHEAISRVLRVRRTGVTEVVGILQKKKLIRSQYGQILILNRQGLERAACECYQIIKSESNLLLK